MFHRLALYTVHIRADAPRALEDPVFIHEGFSWGAFLFGPFWAFYHRLWLPGFLLLAALVAADLTITALELSEASYSVLQISLGFIAGLWGNDWWRAGLKKRGYTMADIVSGESLTRAEQRFFDRHFPDYVAPLPALPHYA
ncbi:MAG: DUF2628 domain-containing protein [Alphaproteobacteria bacterium]|nr:DUF2628 domain-containing protein [Alphaproteobacteria bacterium]